MRRVLPAAVTAALLPLLAPVSSADAAVLCDVSGKVRTAAGTAFPGVRVVIASSNGMGTVLTGDDGTFALATNCGSAQLSLQWSNQKRFSNLPRTVWLDNGPVQVTDGARFDLRLPGAVKATVRVLDPAGLPLPGVAVNTGESGEAETDPVELADGVGALAPKVLIPGAVTDAEGSVTLLTFPDHDMHVEVAPDEPLQPYEMVLDARKIVTKTVTLSTTPQGEPLAGVVRDAAGRGVPGMSMGLAGTKRGYGTDADGAFTVYGPTASTNLVGGYYLGDQPQPATADIPENFRFDGVPVTAGPGRSVVVTLPPVSHVRIHVLDSDGNPVPSAELEAHGDNLAEYATDPAVLVPDAPAVPLTVTVEPKPSGSDGVLAFNIFHTETVGGMRVKWRFAPGADVLYADVPAFNGRADQDITVRMPAPVPAHAVTGTMRAADGGPLGGLQITAGKNEATTDADGRFSIKVGEGDRVLQVSRERSSPDWAVNESTPDSFTGSIPLHVAGPTDVTIKLPRAYRVTVHAVRPDNGLPVVNADLYTDIEFVEVTAPVGGSAPATFRTHLSSPGTDRSGNAVLRSWPVKKAPQIDVRYTQDATWLFSRIVDLEISGDKRIDVVLGTQTVTYSPPGAASGVAALVEPEAAPARAAAPGAASDATAVRSAAVSGAQATVHWTAPRGTGNSRITAYRVTASPGGRAVTASGTARSATIHGLAGGTTYSFSVTAVNTIGRGKAATARLDLARPTASMTGPSTKAVTGKTVRFTWKGTDDVSGVARYELRVRSAKAGRAYGPYTTIKRATTGTSYLLDLAKGYQYCMSVRATDRVGRVGAWSAPRCVSRPA